MTTYTQDQKNTRSNSNYTQDRMSTQRFSLTNRLFRPDFTHRRLRWGVGFFLGLIGLLNLNNLHLAFLDSPVKKELFWGAMMSLLPVELRTRLLYLLMPVMMMALLNHYQVDNLVRLWGEVIGIALTGRFLFSSTGQERFRLFPLLSKITRQAPEGWSIFHTLPTLQNNRTLMKGNRRLDLSIYLGKEKKDAEGNPQVQWQYHEFDGKISDNKTAINLRWIALKKHEGLYSLSRTEQFGPHSFQYPATVDELMAWLKTSEFDTLSKQWFPHQNLSFKEQAEQKKQQQEQENRAGTAQARQVFDEHQFALMNVFKQYGINSKATAYGVESAGYRIIIYNRFLYPDALSHQALIKELEDEDLQIEKKAHAAQKEAQYPSNIFFYANYDQETHPYKKKEFEFSFSNLKSPRRYTYDSFYEALDTVAIVVGDHRQAGWISKREREEYNKAHKTQVLPHDPQWKSAPSHQCHYQYRPEDWMNEKRLREEARKHTSNSKSQSSSSQQTSGNQKNQEKAKNQDQQKKQTQSDQGAARKKAPMTRQQARSILLVSEEASADEIRSAWKKLIKQHHPDRVAHKTPANIKAAEEKSKEINEAYATLK